MRLTHTSRAKEHKSSDGMVRVFQPYTATQDLSLIHIYSVVDEDFQVIPLFLKLFTVILEDRLQTV